MSSENMSIQVGHYTSLEVACEHILPSGNIRFSPFQKTNDPRENKERVVSFDWSGDGPPPENWSDISNRAQHAILNCCQVFCGTLDAKENPHKLKTKLCFGHPRMWAQYGNSHRGICLVFDRDKLTDAIIGTPSSGKVYKGEVVYNDFLNRELASDIDLDYDLFDPSDIECGIEEHIEKFQHGLFFRKDSDWASEDEYRWVIYRRAEGYVYVPFGDALTSIVLGTDCPDVYIPLIKDLSGGVPARRLCWEHYRNDFAAIDV